MTRSVTSPRFGAAHALAMGYDPERYFRRRANEGETFAVGLPGLGEVLFASTAAGVREIFGAPATLFSPPTPNPIAPLVGDGSLILLSGERHRRERTLLMPSFHGERMRAYADVMAHAAAEEIESWRPGADIAVRAAAQSITLHIIIRTVFGVSDRARRDEYERVITALMQSYIAPLMFVPALRREVVGLGPWARFVRLRAQFDALLSEQIAERRRTGVDGYDDVLSLLLSATYEDGTSLSDEDLRQELRTLLVAGHETTATSLAWAMYHIHHDDGVRERLVAELAADHSPADVAKLPYLNAICQETLRMHPTVSIVLRRLNGPLTIRGVQRSEGDVVGVAVPALHFDPKVFPEPDTFDPDRFLLRKPTPFEFTPFGGGHRRCVGAAFANFELAVVLATIVKGAELEMSAAERRRGQPRSVPRGIAVLPSREIVLRRLRRS
ncbi:cytochrome P450 [Antrihabitans sp. NCIMB 15449]|uniref:Cytochrome P450 n=1 Tax=Antrihabitans spumae TaxID=3373370 RepID=A0ABW7JMC6_9NOCA